jgi:putative PIG3 family NAD(P)H quinone oxidoreductase
MRAIRLNRTGGPDVLEMEEVAVPVVRPGHVIVAVHAAALNYADLLQRRGTYGAGVALPTVLGIECSGTIVEIGAQVDGWSLGDRVCCLVDGGGYAERVSVPANHVLPVPRGLGLAAAAALPEAAGTVWSNVVDIGGLSSNAVLLVHGGAGGIGSFAIQAGRALGARVFATAGGAEKLDRCRTLGAERAIDYKTEDFVAVLREVTQGRGADVILDNMGALYLGRNIDALAMDGRLVVIGLQGGREGEIPLDRMMAKRGSLLTTSLRDRPAAEKARIVAGVRRDLWPYVESGGIIPVVDRTFPLEETASAHEFMESGRHIGKIVLTVGQ